MAAPLEGLIVTIIVKSPPNARIQGRVSNVIDQTLTLHDVVFLGSGLRMPEFRIHGSNIIDLDVSPENFGRSAHETHSVQEQKKSYPAPVPNGVTAVNRKETEPGKVRQEHPAPSSSSAQHIKPLTDPAILSIRYKPSDSRNGVGVDPTSKEQVQDKSQRELVKATSHLPNMLPQPAIVSVKFDQTKLGVRRDLLEEGDASTSDAGTVRFIQPDAGDKSGKPIGVTTRVDSVKVSFKDEKRGEHPQPANDLTTNAQAITLQSQGILPVAKEGQRRRRRGRKKRSNRTDDVVDAAESSGLASEVEDKEIVKKVGGQKVSFGKEKSVWSWKTSTGNTSGGGGGGAKTRFADAASRSRRGPRRGGAGGYDDNDGWATEDATDIQGMGEFDFQGNLSKFDKTKVFDQIRAHDHTAKESRLINLNRLTAKPGTAGGKNLHHTENVLDARDRGRWNSEAGETDDDTIGEQMESGRSSRRTMSRQSTKHVPSRKGTLISSSSARVMSPLNRDPQPARPTSSIMGRYSRVGSPIRSMTPSASSGTLRVLSSGRLCPVLRPVQQLDIERIAEVELGLTEEMMTENAGRGIAEIALMALDADGRRPAKEEQKIEPPFAVVLAGNHQAGLRALAAARHLHNHGTRVIVCMLGQEREAFLLESVRRQLLIFERSGGIIAQWEEMMTELEQLNDMPELVIDALLGTHLNFGDLRRDDQTVAYNLIDWVNNGKFDVLAVEIPTGIDASTGNMSYLEGEPMCMDATVVVAMGAPKAGLVEALASGIGSHWKIYVVDLGISNTAWKTYGTKRRHGIEFGSGWAVEVQYQGVSSD
ncbi:MAG: enhancer of mRNA decapping [Peltula sp. TS41687]|nr:MAG: enhancer of mRNA decapping [Peltula sp. TS41687]